MTTADRCDHPLDFLFTPSSVAVVGASKNPDSPGYAFLRQLLEFPFRGPVYPIHPRETEILGTRCYQSLREIPGPVDLVISSIPHHQVLPLVEDCAAKGVRALHLYTARLAETQLEERRELEREVIRRAREGGMRVIGPNCMGIYCPAVGLTFRQTLPREAGHVAFASQSGGNAAELEYLGAGRGLRFSKIVSFGNASDLNESDFLEYFLADPQTRVIGLYLEGMKEGRRFQELLRQADGVKPLVLYKGGSTRAGARAVTSHTASLSGDEALWDALCVQHGVVRVPTMEELSDVLLAVQLLPPASGRRVLVMGGGGGGSVSAADACELEGLEVPPLPPEMRNEIRGFAPDVWSLISNPLDGSAMGSVETMNRCYELGTRWEGADLVIANTSATWFLDNLEGAERHTKSTRMFIRLAKEAAKPAVVFITAGDTTMPWRAEAVLKAEEECAKAGVPAFPNIHRAARALSRFVAYHRRLSERALPDSAPLRSASAGARS
jgi:acyl-CoA synthetase (NDP forming)